MDRENEPMSETAILPSVDVVKKDWKKNDVITFLQREDLNLDLDGEDIEIIRSKKIGGKAFLSLTKEELESYGLQPGPAIAIAELVKEIKGEQEQPVPDLLITEQDLFRTAIPDLSFIRIKTKSTVKSASRRVPTYPVKLWDTFLNNAFNASLSIDAVNRRFFKPDIPPYSINSENTTVDLFVKLVDKINDQRLASLQNPQMWCRRNQAPFVKGEPDLILIGAPNRTALNSTNEDEISLIATVEAKPDQLMNNIIQEIINERCLSGGETELYKIYNEARIQKDHGTNNYSKYKKLTNIVHQGFGYMVVNDMRYGMITTTNNTWFMARKAGEETTLLISPAVSVNQAHTQNQASFWECLRYFEDLSASDPFARSPPGSEPLVTDSDGNGDSDNQEDPPPPPPPPPSGKKDQKKKKDPDYNPSRKRKLPSYTGSGMGSRTRSKTKSNATNNTELRETKEDTLLKYMKNYDRNHFIFGHILGYGRTGSIFETTLGRKTGALKMVALYKDGNKLEELLSEIKIYIGPLKDIQGIHIPILLKFGVLFEAFVFILTSLAEETFATMGHITKKEKELAVKGLQELHSRGVMHGDIRLENIMVKRKNKGSTSCVWWIDFGWSKMTGNVKELDKELIELKYLLGMA